MSLHLRLAGALALAAVSPLAARQINLVKNGDFELNGGVGQIKSGISSVNDWTSGPSNDQWNPTSFNFVLNGNADSTGFPSQFSPPNIYVWGPNNPPSKGGGVQNGFGTSNNGGFFVGMDGGYATGSLSQTIDGLLPGKTYTLTFEWAASQFTDASLASVQSLDITFGTSAWSTTPINLDGKGFSGWRTATTTFVAQNTSQVLSFLANGQGPNGLPPFTLLDDVRLTVVPEPSSYAAWGTMALIGFAAVRRARRSR